MRTIFGFNQIKALEKGLDLVDLYLLEYILYIYAEDKNKINIENNYFSKINYLDLAKELPILKINTKKSVKCRLFNLQKKNLIFRCCQREGQKVFTLIKPNCDEIFKIV